MTAACNSWAKANTPTRVSTQSVRTRSRHVEGKRGNEGKSAAAAPTKHLSASGAELRGDDLDIGLAVDARRRRRGHDTEAQLTPAWGKEDVTMRRAREPAVDDGRGVDPGR